MEQYAWIKGENLSFAFVVLSSLEEFLQPSERGQHSNKKNAFCKTEMLPVNVNMIADSRALL